MTKLDPEIVKALDLSRNPYGTYDHWWRIGHIKELFRYLWQRPKYKRDRLRKGYTWWDLWDLDRYLLALLYVSLHEFADKTIGYPNEYETFESWQQEIHEAADKFGQLYKWEYSIDGEASRDDREGLMKKAFAWLGDHIEGLWI